MAAYYYPHFLSEASLTDIFQRHAPFPFDFQSALMRIDFSNAPYVAGRLATFSIGRIYDEWCMEGNETGNFKRCDECMRYAGDAADKFFNDEKLYASQRVNLEVSMPAVVDAFARSACDFFIKRCDWKTMMPLARGVNIRRSLEAWIENPELVLV